MTLRWACCSWLAITQLVAAQSKETASSSEPFSHLLGYTAQASQTQKEWEKKFRDGIAPDNIRENMRRLSARPHLGASLAGDR
jgi:hypothetical protein